MAADEVVWDIRPGEYLSREDRRVRFGGARYGGIEPSAKSNNVFIYSDPARGEIYGYKFDGWNHDQSVYLYTGEGRIGDQVLKDGNRAIATHREDGRTLRLFVADGEVEGKSKAKLQLYVGEFQVDPQMPYYVADAPDEEGEIRTVFVFRLIPVGAVERRKKDSSAESEPTDKTKAQLVEIESVASSTFVQRPTEGVTAQRTESQLVKRFTEYLLAQNHEVKRWKLLPSGEISPLLTDLYDVNEKELFEAKGSATRNHVRLAIGQLFDYKRLMVDEPLKLSILLPHEPSNDLKVLIKSVGFGCVWETAPGFFVRM
jgi:hypothetical protein